MIIDQRPYITSHPLPNDYERELLTILIEECAEVQKRATKLMRFGAMDAQPGQSLTNKHRLSFEIGDVLKMIERLKAVGLIDEAAVLDGMRHKARQLEKYIQTKPPGAR